jgi:hypothetical protein
MTTMHRREQTIYLQLINKKKEEEQINLLTLCFHAIINMRQAQPV